MFESPFQNAVDNEVRIATNGRSEMRIFIEAQSEMAEMHDRLLPGVLTVWLIDYRPSPEQLGGDAACATERNLRWCLLP